ncbi:hypothetical protein N9937_01790, partial [bacterium]|nr:hypothetical protein [bacterium]
MMGDLDFTYRKQLGTSNPESGARFVTPQFEYGATVGAGTRFPFDSGLSETEASILWWQAKTVRIQLDITDGSGTPSPPYDPSIDNTLDVDSLKIPKQRARQDIPFCSDSTSTSKIEYSFGLLNETVER